MKTVFFGTPQFAVPTLDALVASGHEVASVYTQPDRPKGRGEQMAESPVKQAAVNYELKIRQPERVRSPRAIEDLASVRADVMVVVGYGQIIPQAIIDLPRLGIVNVHASLLPRYRGAAPIQWAIANGEMVTGVTTMLIDAGLDTGDMLLRREVAIGEQEDAVSLSGRLADLGAGLLIETLRRMEAGDLEPQKQDRSGATHAPSLMKRDGLIDWTRPASEIYNRSRGFLPWPGTYTHFRGHLLHIWKAKPVIHIELGRSGSIHPVDKRLLVACAPGTALELEEIQLEGRKRITADAFRNGQRLTGKDILGDMTN